MWNGQLHLRFLIDTKTYKLARTQPTSSETTRSDQYPPSLAPKNPSRSNPSRSTPRRTLARPPSKRTY